MSILHIIHKLKMAVFQVSFTTLVLDYLFTPCGANGTSGPSQDNCNVEYNNTNVNVTVLSERTFNGIQKWTVPKDGFYT